MDMGIPSKGGSEIVHRIIASQWVTSDWLLFLIVYGMVVHERLKLTRANVAMRESIIVRSDGMVRDTGVVDLDEGIVNDVTCKPVSEVIALLRFAAVGMFFLFEVRIGVNTVVVCVMICWVINCIVGTQKTVVEWHVLNFIHVLYMVMWVRSAHVLWLRVVVGTL